MKTIQYGAESWILHDNGQIERPGCVAPSEKWRIVGAVRFNNFGHEVERVSLDDILAGKIKDWKHKNGKQKWHVVDFDHGSIRVWMNPGHAIW